MFIHSFAKNSWDSHLLGVGATMTGETGKGLAPMVLLTLESKHEHMSNLIATALINVVFNILGCYKTVEEGVH